MPKKLCPCVISRRKNPDEPHDACRVHGSLTLNKVSGNFHIAAGKSVPLMRGHAHLTTLFDDIEANFSHRIDRFSFGESHGSIIQPLEGDENIAQSSNAHSKFEEKKSFFGQRNKTKCSV